ncbi:hypothetical protein [Paenibacillus hexagrammi]|uniref:Uncharacterized protein n=1 Tax=Paenibacillus hexagrammi TaxID=2908839 RepID=A0ABY3SFK9_9BACL|nr:hypothetical protein [Paenibacillus sp. YPD9-1]UJF32248.1 hypothetical protein L0M14_21370 [Paenibacillus sp. YPD9-1]
MNRKWMVSLAGCTWVVVSFVFATVSAADSMDLPKPQFITTVKDAPFYAHMSKEVPTGAVSRFQTLKVKEIVGDGKDVWYKIDTWLGEQWMPSTDGVVVLGTIDSIEEIHEEPADFDMLLTREEQLYEIPGLTKASMTLAPQTVHVLSTWDTGQEGYRFREIIWYKIQTDQGPLWVLPKGKKRVLSLYTS